MTRPELHALVDIVMDARERAGENLMLEIKNLVYFLHTYGGSRTKFLVSANYPTFSDFTQAVKEYIKTLEK